MAGEDGTKTLERIKIIGGLFAAILVPISVALTGHWYTSALKERESRTKFVELAINILQAAPTNDSESLRQWAVDTINENSEIKLSEPTQSKLVNEIRLGGDQLPAAITSVALGPSDDIQINGTRFGVLAGEVYISKTKSNGGVAWLPLDVDDWEASRIKAKASFLKNSLKVEIKSLDGYQFRIETRDGRIGAPFVQN